VNKIQMVDLKGQYLHIKSEVDAAIQKVLNDTAFIQGEEVGLFANELGNYFGAKHVIPCANGTDALQIALMALDLPADAEVIVPTFNYVATAEVIALLGYKPVFLEVDEKTYTISPEAIEKSITAKTKVIIPVHLYGQCADMDSVMEIAKKYNLYVIEDNAQAIGAEYFSEKTKRAKAGTIGDIGTTSFFPSKNLGCYGDGGAIYTNNPDLAEKLKMIANHGQKKKYHYDAIGVNSRLDTLQAAILRVKLKNLDSYISKRNSAASYYDKAFANSEFVTIPFRNPNSTHVFHQYTLRLKKGNRDELKEFLQNKDVPSMIYYPVPIHLNKAYEYLGYKKGDFTLSEKMANEVISLPMHTELEQEQQDYIINAVNEYFKQQ
jgi:UDP-2-acetamido-2-deoxy-ribo-hexuluronate aminotransferase